jgi:hypothetical protein
MLTTSREPLVFLSYASPDRERVVPFYDALKQIGIQLWIDTVDIKGGQNWDFEIRRALDRAAIVIVFISSNSVDRRGYVQKEIRWAIDKAGERLCDDVYIIPLALDRDVAKPRELSELQFIYSDEDGAQLRLEDAIRYQLEKVNVQLPAEPKTAEVGWSTSLVSEKVPGLPGLEARIRFLRFSSAKFPGLQDAADVVRGGMIKEVMRFRAMCFESDGVGFNFGQSYEERTDKFDASSVTVDIVGRTISVCYAVNTFRAKAAHAYRFFRPFALVCDPVILIGRLDDIFIFTDPNDALIIIQRLTRSKLLETAVPDSCAEFATRSWDAINKFIFRRDGLTLLFSDYDLGAYNYGSHVIRIEYDEFASIMKTPYASALDIRS